jgi:hypothetical protein
VFFMPAALHCLLVGIASSPEALPTHRYNVPLQCAAAMLLAPGCGTQLKSSLWLLGARMAFVRRLRLDRAEPELNTSNLATTTERFCRAVRASEEEYAAFEQRWLASSEAAELCRHEGPPRVRVIGAPGAGQ